MMFGPVFPLAADAGNVWMHAAAILRKQLDGQVDRQTVAGSGWGDIQSKLVLYGAA